MGLLGHLIDSNPDDERPDGLVAGEDDPVVAIMPGLEGFDYLDRVGDLVFDTSAHGADTDGVEDVAADFHVPSAESFHLASGATEQEGSAAVSRYAMASLDRIGQRADD